MMNKKTIAIATAAMSVAGAVVPVFADYERAVLKDEVSVRTANGRELAKNPDGTILAVHETNLKEYLRSNADKNAKVVGKYFQNEKAYYAVEIDMDLRLTANKNEKAQAEIDYNKAKKELENMKKEQYNGKARYTFEVRENSFRIKNDGTVEDGNTTVFVTDNKDAQAKVLKYVFTGAYKFVENDVVDVKKENVDLSKANNEGYKELAKYAYQIEAKGNKVYVTTTLKDSNTLVVNIFRTDKKVQVGRLTINGYDGFNKDTYKKYTISAAKSDFAGHWAQNEIIDAMHDGHVVLSSSFRPKDAVTRAEFAKMVVQMNKLTKGTEKVKFSDVQKENWFYSDIEILASNGYINGYTDGTFKPNATITRQEAAAILASIEGINETFYTDLKGNKVHTDIVTKFADDKSIAAWADESIKGLSDCGVIKGYNENGREYFKPANKVDRAEALVMAQRVQKAHH